jgi:hypothetical protein
MNTYTLADSKLSTKFGYQPSDVDRMFCYLWFDTDHPNECKFGERWVKANIDPELDVWERIRGSLGVQKTRVDLGKIRLAKIWDATAYGAAKAADRLKAHGKMDDFIRPCIGRHRKGSEVHELPFAIAASRIDAEMHLTAPGTKPKVRLRLQQATVLDKALAGLFELSQSGRGDANIVANLCPRFGKTVWALMLFNGLHAAFGTNMMVVPVYWLSVMTSFADEVEKYDDFDDITVVRLGDADAEKEAAEAISAGRRVLALVSLCGVVGEEEEDSVWIKKHQWLANAPKQSMFVFADEADFGTHTVSQQKKLEFLFG